MPHPPMRSLETSAGSQLPPFTLPPEFQQKLGGAARAHSPSLPPQLPQAPSRSAAPGAHLQRTPFPDPRRPGGRVTAGRPRRSYSLLRSALFIHSTPPKCSSLREAEEPGSAGALRETGRGEARAASPGRGRGRQPGGAGEKDAEPCGAAGRTGPGRQCAFVYVARAAAANMHLKSARVSPRQRPAVQSPSRRAPRTPGPRSLWYISDLTSRLGLILRWERFTLVAHLGGFFFFFPIEV